MNIKNQAKLLVLLILVLVVFMLPKTSTAAGLFALSDKMTRQAPFIESDHEIRFTTPSGLGNSGQYLRIVFDAGFDLSQIDYTDIDLFHGAGSGLETQENLAGTPGTNDWGVAVSGLQIDFTHPTDNANGDIAPGNKVVIRIGFNASGGDQQIVNPVTSGSKIITITGNFGDIGKLAVAIFQDQVGVGGQTIAAPPSPVILNPPYNITTSSMDLNWTINSDFDFNRYELYYSTNPAVTNTTGILAVSYTNRFQTSFSLPGLEQDTTYYFKVYVYDNEALFTPSNEVSGTTLTSGHQVPPFVAQPTLQQRICPIFLPNWTLQGTKPSNTTVVVNGSSVGVIYPTDTSWNKLVSLVLGDNHFDIYAQNDLGYTSAVLSALVVRWRVGDTNGNFQVDDFDLSGLAANFWSDWCYADFNEDYYVDDFDLSGLAANWDNIY